MSIRVHGYHLLVLSHGPETVAVVAVPPGRTGAGTVQA